MIGDDKDDDGDTVPGAIARMTASEQAYRVESMTLLIRTDRNMTRLQERVKRIDERQDEHAEADVRSFAAIDRRFEKLEMEGGAVISGIDERQDKNDDFRKEMRWRADTLVKVALLVGALISFGWGMFEHYSNVQAAQAVQSRR